MVSKRGKILNFLNCKANESQIKFVIAVFD